MQSAIDVRRPRAEVSVARRPRLPIDVLTIALGLSLWMATGCLVLAVAEGLGAHPVRRLVIGVGLVIVCALALKRRRAVCSAFRDRPWLVLPLAALQLGVVALDELIGTPFIGFLLTSIGIAAIVARPRTVWMCVLLLDVGYLALALVEQSPAGLVSGSDLGTVLGVLVGNVAAAVPLMLLRQRFDRAVTGAPQRLQDIRDGAPAFTPALTRAIAPERPALPAARARPDANRARGRGGAGDRACAQADRLRARGLRRDHTHAPQAREAQARRSDAARARRDGRAPRLAGRSR